MKGAILLFAVLSTGMLALAQAGSGPKADDPAKPGQSRILGLPLNREGEPLVLFERAAKDEKGECKVHHHALTVAVVPIAYGLLPGLGKEYYAVELRDFPNAMTRYEGGCVVTGAKEAKVLQCQKCLAAKKAWMEGQDRK